MEQYQLLKKEDFKNLRFCLDNYKADFLSIRDCGGYNLDGSYRCRGLEKVTENLENKKLDFRKDRSGLYLLIDSKEVFHFPLKEYFKGFSLAYERFKPDGTWIIFSPGLNPYDKNLPEPKRSFLRNAFDSHEVEIYFKGRINIRFHSWWKKYCWKYWTIKKP